MVWIPFIRVRPLNDHIFSRVNEVFMKNWLHGLFLRPKKSGPKDSKDYLLTYFTRRSYYRGVYMVKFQCRSLLCEFTHPTQITINIQRFVKESISTVEPLLTDTTLIRTPLYYGKFPTSRQISHIYSLKKKFCNTEPL